MAIAAPVRREPVTETLADLMARIGNVPLDRVRLHPWPATIEDVINLPERDEGHFELVEGVLIEKAMGLKESLLATELIRLLATFVKENRLGVVTSPDGTLKLDVGLVRIPDVSFISRDRMPGGKVPEEPIPLIAPDLAVEIVSTGNTRSEMQLKLKQYFAAGAQLVWYLYPKLRLVKVFTSATDEQTVTEDEWLDGGAVLPGFRLLVRSWLEAGDVLP